MKIETAPANASRDRPVRFRALCASTRSERPSTKLWSASARWLRKTTSTSEPTPNDLRRFHISFPFPSCCPSYLYRCTGQNLTSVSVNAARLGSRLLPLAEDSYRWGVDLPMVDA